MGVFSDWKAVACSPQNFTLHFSISLGAAANISPAWFAGYRHKSDLGLKKISRPVKALSFFGASRIYVHVHYPTDVIVGAIVGIIAGLIATLVLDKLLMPKVFPWVNAKLKRNILPTLEPKHSKLEEEAA